MRRATTFAASTRIVLRRARDPSPAVATGISGARSISGNLRQCYARPPGADPSSNTLLGQMTAGKRSLSGIRVTGRFHIGNYLGAGINYVRLQDEYESYIFVADYHTLTTKPDARDFRDDLYDMVMDLIAIGVDPDRTVIYRQSSIPMVAELTLLLAMVTPLSWVQRVPTFKEKVRDQPENVNLGLFEYPVLQAADIIIVKGDVVPVGRDQAAHVELTREITRTYKTQPGHPRSCNVCAFYKFFFDDWEHYWDLCRKAQIGCYDKKKLLAERIVERFAPFRERRAELTRGRIDQVLESGAERAHALATKTMVEVRDAVGLPPYSRT